MKLLEGVPVYGGPADEEVVTPTGAALMATLAREFGRYPEMIVESVGYGAGTLDFPWPNVLRLVIGKLPANGILEDNLEKYTQGQQDQHHHHEGCYHQHADHHHEQDTDE